MGNFFLNNQGVWYQQEPNVKGELPSPIWVCSPLEITAITRDDNNENHGKLLRFFDYDGIEHKWAMPMELLAGDGTFYRQALLSGGLQIQQLGLWQQSVESPDGRKKMLCGLQKNVSSLG